MNWEARLKPENAFTEQDIQLEEFFIDSIADDVCENMQPDHYYILDHGKITSRILSKLGIQDNFSGPKVVENGALVASDPNKEEQIKYFENENTSLIISPNRKGVLLGENKMSSKTLRKLKKEKIIIIAPPQRLVDLKGTPLTLDTGDSNIDHMLSGYYQVITSYRRRAVYKASPI